MIEQALFWAITVLALVGAVAVAFTRDVMRLGLGLGAFLLAVAAYFALFGFGFLALAELFLYVGGVLVLVLFAIMLVHRSEPGMPSLESRHDPLVAVTCVGFFALIVAMLRGIGDLSFEGAGVDAIGATLLGPLLPQFELVGVLLLAALVAVVVVTGEGRK